MDYIKSFISWKGYFPVYFIIYAALNFLLLNFPLVAVFSYEFNAVNGLLIVIISGFYTIGYLKSAGEKSYFESLYNLRLQLLLIVLIPLIAGILSHFLVMQCAFGDGLVFYFVLTLPGLLIGTSLGFFVYTVSFSFTRLVFFTTIFLIALIPVIEIYFNPQIYFYSPLIGFFPGNIYDEALGIDLKIVIYRILNLFFFSGLFLVAVFMGKSRRFLYRILTIISVIIFSGVLIIFAPLAGFSSTAASIKTELTKSVETDKFIIYYTEDLSREEIIYITLLHEYYFFQLENYFGVKPETKTETFIFRNRNHKKQLFGAGVADVAKPWLNQIYISADSYERTLKHELAHCFSAQFGAGIFRLAENFNPFLIEGVAEAADPIFGDNDIHFLAAVANRNGYNINIENLFSGLGFFSNTSSLSYVYAGSFVRFLIENYGMDKFKQFYSDADIDKNYGNSQEVIGSYYTLLKSINAGERKGLADYYFGRQSIFHKVCPRFTARRVSEGHKLLNENNIESAKKIFVKVLEVGDNYPALIGLAQCLNLQDSLALALNLMESHSGQFKSTSYYPDLILKTGDYHVMNNSITQAMKLYSELKHLNPSRLYVYAADLRLKLAEDMYKLKEYVSGSSAERYYLLADLNLNQYHFTTIPFMIELSEAAGEDYLMFLRNFNKTIFINDEASSFAMYKLSQYMLKKLDFTRARKMAALSLRYIHQDNFVHVLSDHYNKTDWLYRNSGPLIEKIFGSE